MTTTRRWVGGSRSVCLLMAGLLVGVVVSSAAWAQEKAAGGVAGPAEAGKSAQAGEGKAAEGKGSGAEGKGGGGAKGPGGEGKGPGADGKGAPAGPPVGVVSVRAQSRDLPEQIAATGTVTPLASVDVRAQMSGVISRVHIKEGQFVRKGDLLFTLDSRADEANVARAVAQLAKDEAALADAQRQLQRNRELVAQRFISQGALDASQTLVESQAAVVAASKAAIEGAKVLLSYAKVVAPGSGRVGTIPVFAGSSVLANQTTLVTVTQLDPISVAFSLPQKHLADSLAALKTGGNEVLVRLPEGGETLKGRLQFVDNLIDAASGTVKVKAVFPNRDSKLWPGAFVKVDMTVRLLKESVVIPIACVIQSPRGAIVYVVQGNVANPRPVQVLYARGEEAAVTGLKPGERVVLEGRQNLRAGTNVVERPPDGGSRGPGKGGGGSGKGDGASGKGEGTPKGEPKAEPKGESKAEPKGEPKVDRKGAA